ncbi:MAG: XrtA system polysaccharide chain length determinant [Gammaproteobacteria bacterium]
MRDLLAQARSAWRFRWHGLAVAWAIALIGLGVTTLLPNLYEASTRVYVDTSSVLRPLLERQIVESDVTTRLRYVREALLGREYIERIARENHLDQEARGPGEREAVLNDLRQRISIAAEPAPLDQSSRNDSSMILRISYRHAQPETAVGVVQMLLKILVNDTLGANEKGSTAAEGFLDQRILEYENRLQGAERALAEFQKANAGRLPGTEGSYFQAIQRDRESLEDTRRKLRLAESRRDRIREQIRGEQPVSSTELAGNAQPSPFSLDARIREHRATLDRLLLEFTDRHPDVIAEREVLARLEEQRTAQLKQLRVVDPNQELFALGANPVFQALQIDLNKAEVEIATLVAEAKDRQSRLTELQSVVDEVPEVEAELARLNRDYNVVREQYQKLIQTREVQSLSRKASDADQVEFRVLNPPRAGIKPVAPPRLLLLATVLAAALAGAAALCVILGRMNPVFSSPHELREGLGIPLFGVVERMLLTAQQRARERASLICFVSAAAGLVVLFGAVVLLEVWGPGIRLV